MKPQEPLFEMTRAHSHGPYLKTSHWRNEWRESHHSRQLGLMLALSHQCRKLDSYFPMADVLIDDSIALQLTQLSPAYLLADNIIYMQSNKISFKSYILCVCVCAYYGAHVEVRRQLWEPGAGLLLLPCGF